MRKTIVTSEVIVLGRQGEDGANKVLFPVRGWKELYGDGQFVVTALRPDENDPYPITTHIYEENDGLPIARRGVFVEWIVGSADVEIPGRGKVELAYYTSDDVRVKSVVYHTVIYDSLGQNSLTPPEPWKSWVDDVREAGADAIQAAEDAESAATRAEDAADLAEDYADAAEEAAQNAQGAVSTAFGQITATATTLSPGSSATASFDPSTKVMHFGIPKGDPGSGGGTSDYDDLDNRPKINSVTLTGDKSSADLSLESRGKITIGTTEYTVTRKALAITENGVTTTYYVADIT